MGLHTRLKHREESPSAPEAEHGGQPRLSTTTLGLALGFSCSSFLAAASMAAAAPSSSFSAMTVGSSGSTHSVPRETGKGSRLNLREASLLTCSYLLQQLLIPPR